MATRRRKLKFASLDKVLPDVERLLQGHVTVGSWSLAQILQHLELGIRLPMESVPVKFSWPVRRLFGPVALGLSFQLGWMPEGVRVPDLYLPSPESIAAQEAMALRATIERFDVFEGNFDEHPLLGKLTRPQWQRFHCLHCAHHLSFALPQ